MNYVRPHAGPEYARIAAPTRVLLKPGAPFPPTVEQHACLEALKKLFVHGSVLAVADECAAILAANAWLSGNPPSPGARPFEAGADTSKIAWGGVLGQCDVKNGKLRPLQYCGGYLSPSQSN